MNLPKYAQGISRDRLVQITCRGKCQMGRYAEIQDNGLNSGGTKITSDSVAKCLQCGYRASDPSNWQRS